MRKRRTMSATGRAIIGVIALYGLLLQGFLAAATPAAAAAALVICAEHGDSGRPDGGPLAHRHGCCTALHVGSLAPPPRPASVAAWADRPAVIIAWRPGTSVPAAGPHSRSHSARGPPAA